MQVPTFFITLKGEALQRRAGVGGQVKKKAGASLPKKTLCFIF
jgi:hypothetical protein